MKPWGFAWAGILCLTASVILSLTMLSIGLPRRADAFWVPLLALWVGSGLVIRGGVGAWMPPAVASLAFLRVCYLVKALMWMLAGVISPEWWGGYWRIFIPLADLCGSGDLILIVIWCTAENLALAAGCGWLLSRRSFVPFGSACLSGLHSPFVRNPLLVATALYLVARTGPWARLVAPQESPGADIGFDAG